jgi:hypothetical protein
MMIRLCLIITFWTAAITGSAIAAEVQKFLLYNGKIGTSSGPLEVTILLDTESGQTWMLEAPNDKAAQWLSLPFSETVPKGPLVPPPAKEQ